GYNIQPAKLGVRWIKNFQLYVSAQNLLTFTKYSWYDPEVNTRAGRIGDPNVFNSFSIGIDNAGYPNAKTYTVGARMTL
ncbi:MAG TPA: hypothetical protein VF610_00960, partial [Segetibacter sp.]